MTAKRCVSEHGFSLHANVRCAANQRKQLERLCRCVTRPAIANERLKRNRAGDVVLKLKSSYQDGTTHIVMSPLDKIAGSDIEQPKVCPPAICAVQSLLRLLSSQHFLCWRSRLLSPRSPASRTFPGILSIRNRLIPNPQLLPSGAALIRASALTFVFKNGQIWKNLYPQPGNNPRKWP